MRRYLIALLLGLTALSAAACGDDADDGGVASVDGATESASDEGGDGEDLDGFEEALAYSECMRDNGVPDFPDPQQNDGGGITLGLPEGMDPESEEFAAAEAACEDMRPGPDGGEDVDPEIYAQLLEYSECMRENGITEFPDPQPNGGIIMNGDMGFDPQSQEFQDADAACADLRPEGPGGPENDSEDE
ncbi:hypothetical protein SAMN05216298_3536 [Glycomyces sambucus]|uniref:PT repeat-containing protein n=1 Tax=Glycomyces sambucus TaxID=380244 RepID=A0A1G9JBN3_9ACTN|nr:hypothetical protein [Glycomyces sambucus]SDL34625.1 hypothetical protein SAMN05216298_3536 [Glycomyces sambucus]